MSKSRQEIAKKPTVNDIASVAGVSLATVDRVLNARPGVREATVRRVRDAIDTLGYVRDTAAANLARGRVYTLLFILPEGESEFVAGLSDQIIWQARKLLVDRTQLRLLTAPPFDPQAYVAHLDALDPAEVDGVAVFGPETPSLRDAIKRVRDRGIAVVALVSDLPTSARDYFVGIDNIAAGRTAARLIGRFTNAPGQILVVTDSRLSREHLERRRGFDALIHEAFPDLEVLPSVEGPEDPAKMAAVIGRVIDANPGLSAIYASTAAQAGLIRYLEERGLAQQIVLVSHELTDLSRQALENGTIDALISQNAGHLIRSAVRLLRATVDNTPINETQERIRIDIYLEDNLIPLED